MKLSYVLVAMAAVSSAQPIVGSYDKREAGIEVVVPTQTSPIALDKRSTFSDWWDSLWKPATDNNNNNNDNNNNNNNNSNNSGSSDSSDDSLGKILSSFSSWLNSLFDSAGDGNGSSTPSASPSVAPPVKPSAAPKSQPSVAPPSPSQGAGQLDLSSWDQMMLVSQNAHRADHSVEAFTWNSTLAKYASDYLNKAQCDFEHSHGPYGENLAMGYPTPQAAVDAWYDEYKDYNYAQGQFSMATGHFTQMVWKGSKQVGCAQRDCGNHGAYVVCEYYPRGNVIGQFVQNVFNS